MGGGLVGVRDDEAWWGGLDDEAWYGCAGAASKDYVEGGSLDYDVAACVSDGSAYAPEVEACRDYAWVAGAYCGLVVATD